MSTEPYDANDVPIRRRTYLRVTVGLTPRTERVVSVGLVDGTPAQLLASGHPYAAVVDIGGRVTHVSRFPSPMERRSTRQSRAGDHHYSRSEEGLVEVNVPFGSLTDLTRVRISIAELPELGPATADDIAQRVEQRRERDERVRQLGYAQIRNAPDWPAVADALDIREPTGYFEIFVDRDGRYRWRLRRQAGAIVAVSGQGFRDRADCEAELTWVRQHSSTAPVRSTDTPRPPD